MSVAGVNLSEWIDAWTEQARYTGPEVDRVPERIESLLKLCAIPVSTEWVRGQAEDAKWASGPYRRSDRKDPSQPEREVEHEILGAGLQIAAGRTCFGGKVVGGANAIALTRTPKIEADVVLLVDHNGVERLYLAEVKKDSNKPWYAAVELLRQLRLFAASSHAPALLHRLSKRGTPTPLALTGLVLAPRSYYEATGQKAKAVAPARRLAKAVQNLDIDIRLAVWDAHENAIADFS